MTTPGSGDGLVRPQNAPSGQQVVSGIQPGTTGGVTLAQYVVVFGTPNAATGAAPGVFVYSGTPGPGNSPVLSLTLATTDPYGNAIAPGVAAGHFGAVQAILSVVAGFGQVLVPTGAALEFEAGGMAGLVGGGNTPLAQIFGPQQAPSGQPLSDRMILSFFAPGTAAGASATYDMVYNDAAGGAHTLMLGNFGGNKFPTVALLTGVQPGTGTSASNVAVSETFHTAALINGWAASNGVAGVYYQWLPLGLNGAVWVEGDIVNAAATGNSVCAQLPAGYRPSVPVNKQASWNNPVASNSASPPWVSVDTAGNIQVTGIEAANHEIFFGFLLPLGAL